MAITRTQFTSQLDHVNATLTRDDIYPLRFYAPGDHDPFAVYDPTEAGGTNFALGKTVQIYSLSNSAETPYDDIKTIIDDGYIPYVRYSGYDYTPLCLTGGRFVFMSMFDYSVIGFMQVLALDNSFSVTTHQFMYQNAIPASYPAEDIFTMYVRNANSYLYDSAGVIYNKTKDHSASNVTTLEFLNAEGVGYTVVEDRTTTPPTYTKTSATSDDLWVHWQNNNGWTTIPDSSTEVTLDQTNTVKAEGSLSASTRPHLAPGLYRFSLEIANHRDENMANAQVFSFDVKVKYGANKLRAMSFLTDASLGSTALRATWWCGGVFRMPADGDVDITIQCLGLNSSKSSQFKMSHLFVNSIGG